MAETEIQRVTTPVFTGAVPSSEVDVTTLGKGIRLASRKSIRLDEALALRLLEMEKVAYERPLREGDVQELMKAALGHTFRYELVNLAYATHNGVDYRINGQHTCWAAMNCKELTGDVTLLHYRVDSEEDLRILYSSYDRGAPRTRAHVMFAHLHGLALLDDMANRSVALLGQGYAFWRWDSQAARSRTRPETVAYKLQTDDQETISKIVDAWRLDGVPLDNARHMRRAPVVAAMLATFEIVPTKIAREFWDAVRTGANLQAGDPRLLLRDRLSATGVQGSQKKDKITGDTMYHWCITAWNAWRRGRTLEHLTVRNAGQRPRPLVRPRRCDGNTMEDDGE